MIDDTAGVEVGEHVLVVLCAHHPHDLMSLEQGVGHNVLVSDHTLGETEDGHLALGLTTPDLHLVIRQLETGHTVYTVQSSAQL